MIGIANPLNIRFNKANDWKGQKGHTRGFCNFESNRYCYRAAVKILRSYFNRGVSMNVNGIINEFAPSTENNTTAYIQFVCECLGVTQFEYLVTVNDYAKLLRAMSVYEVGKDNAPAEHVILSYICDYIMFHF